MSMSIKQTILFLLIVVILQLLYCQLNASPLSANNNNENLENQHITRFKRQSIMGEDMMGVDSDYNSTGVIGADDEPGVLERLANYAMQLLKKFVQWMNSEN